MNDKKPTLEEIRQKARERLKGICSINKVCDGDAKRLCQGQKYGNPIGFGGAGKGLGFRANIEALDRVHLKTNLISEHEELDTSIQIFGKVLEIPIMASSLSGVKASMGGCMEEIDFAKSILEGCKIAGTMRSEERRVGKEWRSRWSAYQ